MKFLIDEAPHLRQTAKDDHVTIFTLHLPLAFFSFSEETSSLDLALA